MNVIINKDEEVTTIILSGRLDTIHSPGFEKEINPLLNGDMKNIIIDCKDLVYVSSSGLRIFLILQKTSNAKQGNLVLKNMREEILEIFKMTGFVSFFKIV